jgi:isopentenyl phosphate kinase
MANPQAKHWPEIRVSDLPRLRASLGGSYGIDVTGGMLSKVNEMCQLVVKIPGLHVRLISGQRSGAVYRALLNHPKAGGTLLW